MVEEAPARSRIGGDLAGGRRTRPPRRHHPRARHGFEQRRGLSPVSPDGGDAGDGDGDEIFPP